MKNHEFDYSKLKLCRGGVETACRVIENYVDQCAKTYVCVRDVHGVVLGIDNKAYWDVHLSAGLVVPDGMPLVWADRLAGKVGCKRITGYELFLAVCDRSQASGATHFFYGTTPAVLDELTLRLQRDFPQLRIVGACAPCFGEQTAEQLERDICQIKDAAPDIIWIGLGSPKQELWMETAVKMIDKGVLIGVGAVFDFYSNNKTKAPTVISSIGFEWFYRLLVEPRRLWKRYILLTPRFIPVAIRYIVASWFARIFEESNKNQ